MYIFAIRNICNARAQRHGTKIKDKRYIYAYMHVCKNISVSEFWFLLIDASAASFMFSLFFLVNVSVNV